MALRDRLRKAAAPYLEPGEQIQAVFLAMRPTMQYNDRAVVATDRRILLLKLGSITSRATGVAGEVQRETKLGPCRGFMHPMTAFGTDLAVNRRFFKDVAEADRAADTFVRSQPPGAMPKEDAPGVTGAAMKRVSPEAGFYADPGGKAGIRYWDGREWSPLLPADLASNGKVGQFPGPVVSPLPEPDGSWQYAASQARRQMVWLAVFAAAAVITLAVALVVNLWWLIFAGLLTLRAFNAWKQRKDFMKLDQTARAGPLAWTGERPQDAASRARRAGIVLAGWLTATAMAVAVMVTLYAWDLSKPHADFTLAVLALGATGFGLIYTYSAWQRFKDLRKIDQTGA